MYVLIANVEMRENISLITSQYLSFKDNAEKFNSLMKYTMQLLDLKDISEQMHYLASNLKNVFMSERCNLWILDSQNVVNQLRFGRVSCIRSTIRTSRYVPS
jgi:hypothetical protein